MKPNSKTKPLYWLNFGYVTQLVELYNICKFQGKLMSNTKFSGFRRLTRGSLIDSVSAVCSSLEIRHWSKMKPNSKTKPLYWLNFGYVIELIELYNICEFQKKLM